MGGDVNLNQEAGLFLWCPEHLCGCGAGRGASILFQCLAPAAPFYPKASSRLHISVTRAKTFPLKVLASFGWNSIFYSEKSSLTQIKIVIIMMFSIFWEDGEAYGAGTQWGVYVASGGHVRHLGISLHKPEEVC